MPGAVSASAIRALVVFGIGVFAGSAAHAAMTCVASGYDVIIVNDKDAEIDAGAVLQWREPFTRTTGTFTLREPLEPGGRLVLAGAMGSNFMVEDGPCEAVFPDPPEGG